MGTMKKIEAYEEAVRLWGDAAGVVELADQGEGARCLVGLWQLSCPIGEVVGPYLLATSRHVFVVRGEGATFGDAFAAAWGATVRAERVVTAEAAQ